MPALNINGKEHSVDADSGMPLLWAIRDLAGLTGTKYGCGIGECGACTVHVAGKAVRSCKVTVGEATGKEITTIEGIPATHALVKAFAQLNVPACGFCIPGQIMQAAALIKQKSDLEDGEIVEGMAGNVCRCGAYARIIAAIRQAAGVSR
ncbi:MAG TPA: (2Fe-2S)-binding protein [Alphaproteobacteria bacterium]|jgi:isoquinoline 1-oxidoreductase alpha subunit|nr:(2Fe-2S)-binding protein [Alphaproteobacteria bacterium]